MGFDTKKGTEGLEESTFDILQVDSFYNTRPWTVLSYIWVWSLLLLKLAILGGDTYTCVSLLAFNRWSSLEYTVYEYKIAKWIFAGCILFRVALLVYQIAWAIHVFRIRNIALAYLNNYARMMYALRSYRYQCLFHQIDLEGFFEWGCFFVYSQLDDALEILVADLPRQVINFMTLRFYATGGDANNDILANIRAIADTNFRLAVVLSVQLCSLIIFLFFFSQFVLAMLLFIPIKVKVSHKGFRLLKDICYHYVNNNVRYLVRKNHKLKTQLVAEGIMDYKQVRENPLLASESSLDLRNTNKSPYNRVYFPSYNLSNATIDMSELSSVSNSDTKRRPPPRTYTASSLRNEVNHFSPMDNPFDDSNEYSTEYLIMNNLADNVNATVPRPPPRTQTSTSFESTQYGTDFGGNFSYNPVSPSLENLYSSDPVLRDRHGHLVDGQSSAHETPFADNATSTRLNDYMNYPKARRAPPDVPEGSVRLPMAPITTRNDPIVHSSESFEESSLRTSSEEDKSSPYPLTDQVVNETPYPVRGMSQYRHD